MSASTGIEWTDSTWNPVRGCSRVSEGCRNCYAERQAVRSIAGANAGFVRSTENGPRWTGRVELIPDRLTDPLKWRKPRRVFVNSLSDLFHESLSFEDIATVFGVMAGAQRHTFQVLTKRPERMHEWFGWVARQTGCGTKIHPMAICVGNVNAIRFMVQPPEEPVAEWPWPLPNVWLGVSVEDQATADERIPLLLRAPAAKRFVSYEPALGAVDFGRARALPIYREADRVREGVVRDGKHVIYEGFERAGCGWRKHDGNTHAWLDWLIVGGESGPGARPFDVEWARSTVRQCKAAGVACFVKQLGRVVGDRNDAGFDGGRPTAWPIGTETNVSASYQGAPIRVLLRDPKGGDMSEWPEEIRVREFPQ